MLKFTNYNIVFQEIPDEVTLAVNLSNCPNRCKGCHSPYLREDTGRLLDDDSLMEIVNEYDGAITCVCFMGGDADPEEVERLSVLIRKRSRGALKTGWYSGKNCFPDCCSPLNFNYIKLGPYIEELGGLDSPTTNQRFYHVVNGEMIEEKANQKWGTKKGG
ncbi:anaerobic ribonucleoside-triphosphate reductase activating protein [Bacteroidales bacterium OttesenSCG-928-B11]|nr:anaerobic ribonucleoside-triphosphate reductase activating protein [Bacteroidales bacterium OttesenSCG-928-E04]MDL2309118.1 anaerobic ribonucleoside-triphosphate reductase activating protein [Bacteroidales bacterium OttesenSCG-928-C03]MDL2312015.1 anaerobic ribonucleoside-triphosphate reductase activating protein [Bacteroidales bacterium OttesenSCG-928-B11]